MPLYPNQIESGILTSGQWNGTYTMIKPNGSFYLQMKYWFDYYLNLYPDWNWLINFRTKETFKASQFEKYAKKYVAVIAYLK